MEDTPRFPNGMVRARITGSLANLRVQGANPACPMLVFPSLLAPVKTFQEVSGSINSAAPARVLFASYLCPVFQNIMQCLNSDNYPSPTVSPRDFVRRQRVGEESFFEGSDEGPSRTPL